MNDESTQEPAIHRQEITHEQVLQHLPHRYPFLLVDKVTAVEPGTSLTAIKNVTANEPFFTGHFPGIPIMPGVLIVEAMAQASGILIFQTLGRLPNSDELYYLAGIDHARFKRMVLPGDQLELHIEVLKQRRDLWKFKGTAMVTGEVVAVAEFMNIKGS